MNRQKDPVIARQEQTEGPIIPRQDLLKLFFQRTGIDPQITNNILHALVEIINEEVKTNGRRVSLPGLGIFKRRHYNCCDIRGNGGSKGYTVGFQVKKRRR